MTERLQRIHAVLRAGNVPCALSPRPGLGPVLHAGTPDSGVWDVMVRDSGGTVWIHDAHGATALPAGSTDTALANAIKLHVVRAWADQGDPEANAVIARLRNQAGTGSTGNGPPRTSTMPGISVLDAALPFDPLQVMDRMIDAGNLFSNAMLAWSPAAVTFSFWGPWGTMQSGYTRR
jgi:hypothetical protein